MDGHTLHALDYIVIAISLLGSLLVGVYFNKRQTNTDTYFAGGRSLPSWAVGMSILATLISSITFLAYPGEGYKSDWILLVQAIMVVIVLSGFVWFIVPLYRKVIGLSTYEYFEKRFGFIARMYSSIAFSFTHFTKMGTVFYLLALAVASMTGFHTVMIIWVVGITIIIITLMGGIEAVIWLDVIQGFMLIGGGILCALVILYTPQGGPASIFKVAMQYHKISFGPYAWNLTKLTFIVMAFNGLFYGIQKYGTDQTIVQRYLTVKTDKEAIKAALIGVLLSLPVWTLFMFIGTALFAFYKVTHFTLPAHINPDAVFPYFIMTRLPDGIAGLVVSALIAAAISSLDSDLNCLAAIGVEDYYVKIKPNCTDRNKLVAGKWIVLVSGIVSLLVATVYVEAGVRGILSTVFSLYAIFSSGIVGILLLGLFSRRANKQGLYVGLMACVIFTAYAVLTSTKIDGSLILNLKEFNFTQHKYMIGVYSHIVVLIVGYIASLFFKSESPDEELLIYSWRKKINEEKLVSETQ